MKMTQLITKQSCKGVTHLSTKQRQEVIKDRGFPRITGTSMERASSLMSNREEDGESQSPWGEEGGDSLEVLSRLAHFVRATQHSCDSLWSKNELLFWSVGVILLPEPGTPSKADLQAQGRAMSSLLWPTEFEPNCPYYLCFTGSHCPKQKPCRHYFTWTHSGQEI